jgi:hypothetical protein
MDYVDLQILMFGICVLAGPSLLLTGGIILAVANCELLEVVSVALIRQTPHGIGLCEASFAYHSPPASLQGTLMTPCPPNLTAAADVAVCYPVAHPERYKVALLASDLKVMSHKAPLIMPGVGAALSAVPIAIGILNIITCKLEDARKRKAEDALDDSAHA